MATTAKKTNDIKIPSPHDWRTTDTDEINKRRLRAREESFAVTNTDPRHPVFSNFQVKSGSGLSYSVEVRDLRQRQFTCDCVDFRINGLGTCKHVEAVLLHLEGRFRRLFTSAKACCTWPSPSAGCWRTKWAWAKPSRPSPRARCCIGWAGPAARSSSRPPR